MAQGIQEQVGVLPAIEAKAHLFQIGSEVLCADAMPCADDAALEQGEGGFNGVGVNIPIHVDSVLVSDGFMAITMNTRLHHGLWVASPFVREHYFHVRRDVFLDVLGERFGLGILSMKETQFPAALADTDNDFFALLHVLVALLFSTDVGLIHLDFAVQHRLIGLSHCVPDAVTEIPRRFIATDPERALNLASRHALFGFTEQKCCCEPLHEGQVRVIENRASGDRELVVTILAVEELLFGFEFDHGSLAAQAARAFREAQARQKLPALLFGRKHGIDVN